MNPSRLLLQEGFLLDEIGRSRLLVYIPHRETPSTEQHFDENTKALIGLSDEKPILSPPFFVLLKIGLPILLSGTEGGTREWDITQRGTPTELFFWPHQRDPIANLYIYISTPGLTIVRSSSSEGGAQGNLFWNSIPWKETSPPQRLQNQSSPALVMQTKAPTCLFS